MNYTVPIYHQHHHQYHYHWIPLPLACGAETAAEMLRLRGRSLASRGWWGGFAAAGIVAFAGLLVPHHARALDNGVGLVPPLGWSTWETCGDTLLVFSLGGVLAIF